MSAEDKMFTESEVIVLIRAWNEAQWTRIEPGCKMPKPYGETVLIARRDGWVDTAYYRAGVFTIVEPFVLSADIAYWRPMPAAPKEAQP